jgi:hypothetical protein
MAKNNTKKYVIAGLVVTVLLAILTAGLNCLGTELNSKVDDKLYQSEKTNLATTVNKIDVRVSSMEKEQIRQGRIQERMAVKLGVDTD